MDVTVEPEAVGLCSARLARIDPWMHTYVESGRLPNALTVVARRGEVVHASAVGLADLQRGDPVRLDTIYRIYSMTKPITSVAVMMLYEAGKFQLDDPVARFIPELADMRVLRTDSSGIDDTVPAHAPITIANLLTHTSGFTYSFGTSGVSRHYAEERLDFATDAGPLAEVVERLSALPLIHQPGSRWHYGVSTDVLGLLVERISGQRFDVFLQQRILEPLAMPDTSFELDEDKKERFASLYTPHESGTGLHRVDDARSSRFSRPVTTFSGGGGLLSTAADYHRFTQMLLNRGTLGEVRLLGRKTVDYMTLNHLPGDLASMGAPSFNETSFDGIGFGLGFSVVLDPAAAKVMCSAGEYAWGGMASTAFWVDPLEDLSVLFFTQLAPSSTYPLRRELRVLTYQAILD